MRSTASLASRFSAATRSTNEVSSGSSKLVHQVVASSAGEVVIWLIWPLAAGAALELQVAGTSGLGDLKFGPTVQLASAAAESATRTMVGM